MMSIDIQNHSSTGAARRCDHSQHPGWPIRVTMVFATARHPYEEIAVRCKTYLGLNRYPQVTIANIDFTLELKQLETENANFLIPP
ncbi:MAG: hypothetical protein CMM07_13790 [Rhodopirellula sp.]|nr:hypothetical protein [Rhodopirellula sp.]